MYDVGDRNHVEVLITQALALVRPLRHMLKAQKWGCVVLSAPRTTRINLEQSYTDPATRQALLPVAHNELVGVLPRVHMAHGRVLGTRGLVMQHCMPVAECTSLHILTTQPHMVTLRHKGGKGQGLCSSPVNTLTTLNHLAAVLIHLLDLRTTSTFMKQAPR